MKKRVVISIGDINGVGLELLLKNHKKIRKFCKPIYCVDLELLKNAAKLLKIKLPKSLKIMPLKTQIPLIVPGKICAKSGAYSYASFLCAINLALNKKADSIVTLPIHKKAWSLAGIRYAGHTEVLRAAINGDLDSACQLPAANHTPPSIIMMLGCKKLFVALFSDHIPLKEVASKIKAESLSRFLLDFAPHISKKPCGVLGLNPHAGDFGVLGDEDFIIKEAIDSANKALGEEVFIGPLVPDAAFVKRKFRYFVAMYHDQGLIPLKTLYFKESINVTLNLPFIRTSVDHGSAFDIAYKNKADSTSYLNAIKEAIFRVRRQCWNS
ncbi:MAG: 4-hydroxythreonine-4-phosphate dehydrogenase [Helicobacteraceae bacterium]|nr:4-hydroxythreonine-4-phosphate dehydrogenase [Helicobacteraceae bacterium]